MALQFSTSLRNAMLDQLETTVGTSAVLKIRTGSAPANCGSSDSGSVLATINLPSDWMAGAASGSKAKSGTWSATASGTGTAAHWRLYASDGTTCHAQGTCTATGGGGDMELDNTSIATSQTVTVSTFSLTAPRSVRAPVCKNTPIDTISIGVFLCLNYKNMVSYIFGMIVNINVITLVLIGDAKKTNIYVHLNG